MTASPGSRGERGTDVGGRGTGARASVSAADGAGAAALDGAGAGRASLVEGARGAGATSGVVLGAGRAVRSSNAVTSRNPSTPMLGALDEKSSSGARSGSRPARPASVEPLDLATARDAAAAVFVAEAEGERNGPCAMRVREPADDFIWRTEKGHPRPVGTRHAEVVGDRLWPSLSGSSLLSFDASRSPPKSSLKVILSSRRARGAPCSRPDR
jgi:hypothetical protein